MKIHYGINIQGFYLLAEGDVLAKIHFTGNNDGFMNFREHSGDLAEILFCNIIDSVIRKCLFIETDSGDSEYDIAK